MKKKVRRPKEIVELIKLDSDFIYIYPTVFGYGLSTKEAKRLHAWLGKAIEYLEQQRGRK